MRAVVLIVFCVVAAACDDSGPTAPARGERGRSVAFISIVAPAFVNSSTSVCAGGSVTHPVTLSVTAGQNDLFLDGVTLRLIDGSSVGGPSVTFPRSGLDAQFGSTLIRVGN